MPTVAESARQLLRDFPRYFSTVFRQPLGLTQRLPHPLISGADLRVIPYGETQPLTSGYVVDERNGLMQITTPEDYPDGLSVMGYYYTWFLPADLEFHANFVALEHLPAFGDKELADLSPVELNVIAMGAVERALYSLLTEFSTETDMSNPEGIFIPAHQRFQQVLQMWQSWAQKYNQAAASLNVGLNRITVTELRRVSPMTGRLVPVFENQELDDPSFPRRVLPVIEPKFTDMREDSEDFAGGTTFGYGIP